MTITPTLLHSGFHTSLSTLCFDLPSISPSSSARQIATVSIGSQTSPVVHLYEPATIVGCGLTWTRVGFVTDLGSVYTHQIAIFVADGTPTPGVLTVCFTSSTDTALTNGSGSFYAGVIVSEWADDVRGRPDVIQTRAAAGGSAPPAASFDNPFALPTNVGFGTCWDEGVITPAAGFTDLSTFVPGPPGGTLSAIYKVGADLIQWSGGFSLTNPRVSAEIGFLSPAPTTGHDHWGWVEDESLALSVEPGLYASQSRPALATGQEPTLGIATFYTNESTIALAFNTAVQGAGYELNNNFYGEGETGNWARDKTAICYIYHEFNEFLFPEEGDSKWIGWVDTSYRPIPAYDPGGTQIDDVFINHQKYFHISGAGLIAPRMPRYVPPLSTEICFIAQSVDEVWPNISRNMYFIPADSPTPTVTNIITADDLHAGAEQITYFAFSAGGQWLAAQVDDRLVILDRSSNTVVLDVVENWTLPYQFDAKAGLLFYTKNDELLIRRWVDGWALNEVSTVSVEFTCGAFTSEAGWQLARFSPDGLWWYNGWQGSCGGGLDIQYRNMSCIMDANFFPVSECQVGGGFTLGIPFGDFSNDSQWYVGGDGNINGGSKAILGHAPTWEEGIRQSASAAVQMRSFQAF